MGGYLYGLPLDIAQIPLQRVLSTANDNLNAAPSSLLLAFSFVAKKTRLSKFFIAQSGALVGTDGNIRVTFELRAAKSDSLSYPSDTILASYTKTGGWSPVAAINTQVEIPTSFDNYELTVGKLYFIVVKNVSVAPTVDYIRLFRSEVRTYPLLLPQTYNVGSNDFYRAVYNGTNWTAVIVEGKTTLTLKYFDGTYEGLRGVNGPSDAYAAWRPLDTRAVGLEFISSYDTVCNVSSVLMYWSSGLFNFHKIYAYINRTLVAVSSYGITPSFYNQSGQMIPIKFSFSPGDTVSILIEAKAPLSGDPQLYNLEHIQNSEILAACPPFAWLVKLESGVWTVAKDKTGPLFFTLDPDVPFSRPINRRQFFNAR